MKSITILATLFIIIIFPLYLNAQGGEAPDGFVSLFNGKDLSGWKIPEGDNGHWKVLNGVIDYDAESESKNDKACGRKRRTEILFCTAIGVSKRRRGKILACPSSYPAVFTSWMKTANK